MHLLPILLILLLIVAAGTVWYLTRYQKAAEVEQEAIETGLGAEVYQKSSNPVEDKLPETNPFQAKTNPFE